MRFMVENGHTKHDWPVLIMLFVTIITDIWGVVYISNSIVFEFLLSCLYSYLDDCCFANQVKYNFFLWNTNSSLRDHAILKDWPFYLKILLVTIIVYRNGYCKEKGKITNITFIGWITQFVKTKNTPLSI